MRLTSLPYVTIAIGAVWLVAVVVAIWAVWPSERAPVSVSGWTYFAQELAVQDIVLEEGRIFVVGIGGMVVIEGGVTRDVPIVATGEVMVRAIARDGAGRLWIAHQNGLSVGTLEAGVLSMQPFAGPTNMLRALAVSPSGALWVGGEGGLFAPNDVALPAPNAEVMTLMFDTNGDLWIGTMGEGVMHLSGDSWTHWSVAEGLPHPLVTSITQDSRGDIWAGTGFYDKGGAVRFVLDDGWRVKETLTGAALAAPKVRAVFEDTQGRLWFGHEYDGITVRLNGEIIKHVTTLDGLPDPEVTTIRQDDAGGIWLGTLKGAAYLTPAAVNDLFSANTGDDHDT